MKKKPHDLNTEGKSADLRKIFCDFWKNLADQEDNIAEKGRTLAEGGFFVKLTIASSQGASGDEDMAETHQESMSELLRQLGDSRLRDPRNLTECWCYVADSYSGRGGSTLSIC